MPYCDFCRPTPRWFPSPKAVTHHRANTPACKTAWFAELGRKLQQVHRYDPHDPEAIPRHDEPEGGYEPAPFGFEPEDPLLDGILPSFAAEVNPEENDPAELSAQTSSESEAPPQSSPPKRHRIVTNHPNRSQTYGRDQTIFEQRKTEEAQNGQTAFRHFDDAETFELAEWLLTSGLPQKEASRLLRTRMVSFY